MLQRPPNLSSKGKKKIKKCVWLHLPRGGGTKPQHGGYLKPPRHKPPQQDCAQPGVPHQRLRDSEGIQHGSAENPHITAPGCSSNMNAVLLPPSQILGYSAPEATSFPLPHPQGFLGSNTLLPESHAAKTNKRGPNYCWLDKCNPDTNSKLQPDSQDCNRLLHSCYSLHKCLSTAGSLLLLCVQEPTPIKQAYKWFLFVLLPG